MTTNDQNLPKNHHFEAERNNVKINLGMVSGAILHHSDMFEVFSAIPSLYDKLQQSQVILSSIDIKVTGLTPVLRAP